ncbi:MAG TPA: tetratricopeptide repeat protein [Thermoanaerobaculia bacterium]|nr:tetratricopeptide repeat protein [Thermoanaerobaculia bacterium]
MDAVEWSFSAPKLDALRNQIEQKLKADRAAAVPAQLLDRLVVHVLRTSSRGEVKERILTKEILDSQISTFLSDIARWAGSPEVLRIRTVFGEIDCLRDLLDEGTRELPANPTPGQILTAAYEVIPFDEAGRQEELDFLASWCASEDRRSILLLTGEGGSGKTRLMLEWCRRLRHQGWHAGFLMRNREKDQILPLLKGTAPRLVVIDYAETRLEIVEPLLIEMGQAPQREGPKLRVVLLARREADWWRNLSQITGDVESLLADSKPRKISALIPRDLGERQQVFQAATAGFAAVLDREIPKDLHVPDLSGASFERALYLHMAAYLALYGDRIETAEDALRQTLSHERRFWGQQDRALKEAIESAVAAVTLVGGVSTFQQAKALLDRVLPPFSLEPREARTLRNLLEDLYRGSERFLDPLQPDLLGEELVAETLPKDQDLLNRLLDGSSTEEGSTILTVLTRLARRRNDQEKWLRVALEGRLDRLGELALNVAVETGDPVGLALAREIEVSEAIDVVIRLRSLCDDDKYQRSVPLREVARIATEKGYMLLRERKSDLDEAQLAEYSRLANNLGLRLSDLGRREEALQATQEAVQIYRQLAQQRPDAFRPDLATSLNNLGSDLSEFGRREEALQATQEAVQIRRQLALQRPDAFRPDLATSLNNLGNGLSDLGRREEAFAAAEEAVQTLSPYFLRFPAAFAAGMTIMVRNYLKHAEAAGAEPDATLLAPILEVFKSLRPAEEPEP